MKLVFPVCAEILESVYFVVPGATMTETVEKERTLERIATLQELLSLSEKVTAIIMAPPSKILMDPNQTVMVLRTTARFESRVANFQESFRSIALMPGIAHTMCGITTQQPFQRIAG